jgi:hypothetical protein
MSGCATWDHHGVPEHIDTLLLLALPASGKSEIRRYLDHLDADVLLGDMNLGPTAQLDDYPYVHLMRRISEELVALDHDPVFFDSSNNGWNEPLDWITLIELVNDDFAALTGPGRKREDTSAVLDRIEHARVRAGAPSPFAHLGPDVREVLARALDEDVAGLDPISPATPEQTIVIEFARGGPEGGDLPLPYPLGYQASIGALSEAILARASVLYVWVDPVESRRRNEARAIPSPEGDASILHHGVPELVMRGDYGVDDMDWLSSQARTQGTIPIDSFDLPMSRFDNRVDRTSFLRSDPQEWASDAVEALHRDLSSALTALGTASPAH